jgi:membrane protease YdiL (CAAX protease family)
VILAWLYNSTNGSLPIVIICHAAVNTAGRFVLPEFSGESYQVVWWFMAGLYVLVAVIVTLLGGAKRLATSVPRPSTGERRGTGER